jgi:SSS family solute:Na+ symporter
MAAVEPIPVWMTWIFVVIYSAILIIIGYAVRKWIRNVSDFLLSGRETPTYLQAIAMNTIIIAGTTAAIVPGIAFTFGYVGHWYITGWIIVAMTHALFLARFARVCGSYTALEWFEAFYDSKVRNLASFVTAFAIIWSPLANVLGGGLIVAALTGWSPELAIAVVGVILAIYMYSGGLWASSLTNLAQFILYTIGFIGILPVALFLYYGGIEFLAAKIPAYQFNFLTVPTGNWVSPFPKGLDFPFASWTTFSVLAQILIMLGINSGGLYWVRAASTRNAKQAMYSWLFAGLITIPFALLLPLIGLYGKALGVEPVDPSGVMGSVARLFPPIIAALIMVAVLAAAQSTAELGTVAGTTVVVRDIYQRIFRPYATVKQLVLPARIMTIVYAFGFGVLGAILFFYVAPALAPLIAIALLAGLMMANVPALWFSWFAPRFATKEAAFFSILIGTVWSWASIIGAIARIWPEGVWGGPAWGPPGTPQYHPLLVVPIVSTITYVIVSAIVKYVTGPWWSKVPRRPLPISAPLPTARVSSITIAWIGTNWFLRWIDKHASKDSIYYKLIRPQLLKDGLDFKN